MQNEQSDWLRVVKTVGRFLAIASMAMVVVLAVSYSITALTQSPERSIKIEQASEAEHWLDPEKMIYDKSMNHLMESLSNNSLRFLIVARDTGMGSMVSLFYAKKTEEQAHKLKIPVNTYNTLEASYLLPKKISFEFATDEFLKKNAGAINRVVEHPQPPIQWGREIWFAFWIGCSFTTVWYVLAPLRRKKHDNDEVLQNGGHSAHSSSSGRAINPSKIQGDMDDLIGLHDIKAEILQIEHMIKNRAVYKAHGIERPFNILMSGPAGTGKTKMASYLAKALKVPMYSMPAGALETGLVGGGSETLNGMYREARQHPMAIVFLDEGQVLLARRGKEIGRKNADDTANTLLAILDGTNTVGQSQVITIVASNFNDATIEMDDAMLRRFPLKVDFRLPNLEERRDILKFYLDKKEKQCINWSKINLNYLADITAGMSPALLNGVTDKASFISIQEEIPIDTHVLFRAFERCSVGLTDRAQTAGRTEERKRVAIHELGHFFMQIHPLISAGSSWASIKEKARLLKISTESVAKVGALGYVLSSQDEVGLKTLTQLEQEVIELYGGAAAEQIFYGERNISIGSSNDFEKATKILDTMVNQLSMYRKAKLNYSLLKGGSGRENLEEIEGKSTELYQSALEGIGVYQSQIKQLAELLMECYVMTKDEVFDWLESCSELKGKALDPQLALAETPL